MQIENFIKMLIVLAKKGTPNNHLDIKLVKFKDIEKNKKEDFQNLSIFLIRKNRSFKISYEILLSLKDNDLILFLNNTH